MLLAEVVIDIPTKSLDDSYTYALPDDESATADALVGCAVEVSFGGRMALGFVVGIAQGEGFDGLKPIRRVLSRSYFDEVGAECAKFLAKRYVAPLSVCVRLFMPPGGIPRMVRAPGGGWRIERPSVEAVDDRWVVPGPKAAEFKPRKNAQKQIAVMEALSQGDIRVAELAALLGNISSTIAALEKRGAVRIERRRRVRGEAALLSASGERHGILASAKNRAQVEERTLTAGQKSALDAIRGACAARNGQVVLVNGITGSGKTEVYLRSIAHTLAEGRNAIVLVPEISLTPQTVARFCGRFGDTVAVLHSRMGTGERFDQWDRIRNGEARVVVGARSALFAPLQNLGLIVIDEEHESTYKQQSAPRYVARDVALWMARRMGGTLVLGSATPSLESLYKANTQDGWRVVEMPERINGRALPEIEIIDMASEFSNGAQADLFSGRLKRAMVDELAGGHKVVLMLNQRGFSRFLLCRDCGFVPQCTSCSTTLTYHARGNRLVCHHCGYSVPSPSACPACGSPYLKKYGVGTQRVEDELRALLDAEFGSMCEAAGEPEGPSPIPIVRMDADTTSGKGAHRRLLEKFAAAPRAVLLGTQMIAKGLDFDDVTLVGVVNADTQLNLPDFRASERTFNLIEQVAGRAGRAELPGRVMVQTYAADNVAIRAAAAYDRDLFLRSELPKRRVLKYPPFVRMANIIVWGKNKDDVAFAARTLHQRVLEARDRCGLYHWDVLSAEPCVLEKIRNDYRWHVIVKAPLGKDISAFLSDACADARVPKGVNQAIDIDPVDLL